MSLWQTCDKGSDSSCISLLGPGSCCFYQKVEVANVMPSANETIAIDSYNALGIPTTNDSDPAWHCYNSTMKEDHMDDFEHKYIDTSTGIEYLGYCDKAIKLTISALTALAMLANY